MRISDAHIAASIRGYLQTYPHEGDDLSETLDLLERGGSHADRHTFPIHITIGALLVRGGTEVLLVEHVSYGILLQPRGHLEPSDQTLLDAAIRELTEETGVDASCIQASSDQPVYVEYGKVPARPDKNEPEHYHLDLGYALTTSDAHVGAIQTSEIHSAAWYPVTQAEELVGQRMSRVPRHV